MFSTRDIDKHISKYSIREVSFREAERKLLEKDLRINLSTKNQDAAEADIIREGKIKVPCQFSRREVRKRISQIDVNEMKRALVNLYYNYEVLSAVSCILWTITSKTDSKIFSRTWTISEFMDTFRLIGTPSVEGYSMRVQLLQVLEFFIAKTSRESYSNLTHELFVGFILNSLRKEIPNFMFVYGNFICSPPIISQEGIVSQCYAGSQLTDYIALENIAIFSPPESMRLFLQTRSWTTEDFLSLYLQVIFFLRFAEERFGYTHYDLHDNNVILRPLPPSMSSATISYEILGKKYTLLVKKVATIIDYGFSRIEFEGKSYGKYGLEFGGVFPNKGNILYDAFKFLMFSLKQMINNVQTSATARRIANALLPFFFSDYSNFEYLVSIYSDNRTPYFLPTDPENIPKNAFSSFVEFIFSQFPSEISNLLVSSGKQLSCSSLSCQRANKILESFGIVPEIRTPTSIFGFALTLDFLQSFEKKSFGEYSKALQQYSKRAYNETAKISSNFLPQISKSQQKLQDFFSKRTISSVNQNRDSYLSQLYSLVEFASSLREIIIFYRILYVIGSVYPKILNHPNLQEFGKVIKEYQNWFVKTRNSEVSFLEELLTISPEDYKQQLIPISDFFKLMSI
jgi:hypothetical protein